MSVTTPVLILPGIGNSGPQHWQTRWVLRHPDWQRVNLGNWDSPVCDDWVRALDEAVQACPSPPVLVAHNLGLSVHKLSTALGAPLPDFSTGLDRFYTQFQQGYPQKIRSYQQVVTT